MPSFTYIVQCADNTLYTGWTVDLDNRVSAHNGGVPGGAKYTKSRRPVTLVWAMECPSKELACRLEYCIKGMSRKMKMDLIEGHNHQIIDYISKDACVIIKG